MDAKLLDQFERAKKRCVPFICLMTHDPRKAAEEICDHLNNSEIHISGKPHPLTAVHWDVSKGLYVPRNQKPYNLLGQSWIDSRSSKEEDADNPLAAIAQQEPDTCAGEPTSAFEALVNVPAQSVVFIHQAHRWLEDNVTHAATIQAAANLRDIYKANARMVVFLAPDIKLPLELRADTLIFDDPLPKPEQLVTLFDKHKQLGEIVKSPADRKKAASFVTGCSWFGAEQALYLSVKKDVKGKLFLDTDELRSLRHRQIEQTQGLSLTGGKFNFDHVAGNKYVKKILSRIMTGNNPPNAIVNVEEINWAMAGATGDNTGVSQDQVKELLDHMEKHGDRGIIFFGVPGCSKSWIVECMGATFGVDTIQFDLGGSKEGEVGKSEQNVRQALKVCDAIAGGNKLWIATCNSVATLDEALLRRYNFGIIYFDLPSEEEKHAVWDIQLARWGQELGNPSVWKKMSKGWDKVDTQNWSAADIRNCCRSMYELQMDVIEAAEETNPLCRQRPHILKKYRSQAHQCYREASTGKYYVYDQAKDKSQPLEESERQITI